MNENFLNLVLKNLVLKTKASFSNPDLKSQVLTKTISQVNKSNQPAVDSVTPTSSAQELLITYQLPIDEENLNITNSFLNKGVSPSKEEIENIKLILQNLPAKADAKSALENFVKGSIQGLDLQNEIIQESLVKKVDEESIKKEFQDLKSEVIKDKSIPAKVRVEISNAIDEILKEIQQSTNANESSKVSTSEEEIVEKVKTASVQSAEIKNQKIVAIAAKGLEKIESIIEEGVSDQVQKDELLKNTSGLYGEIGKLKDKLSDSRKELIAKIDSNTKEFVEAKENIRESVQKIKDLLISKSNTTTNQNREAVFQEKIPVFLKSLSNSDEILAKFGEYISAFPQSLKPAKDTTAIKNSTPNISSNSSFPVVDNQELAINGKKEQSNQVKIDTSLFISNILRSLEDNTIDDIQDPLANPLAKTFNDIQSSNEISSLTSNPTFKFLYQVANIAESLQDNLQAIKNVINQTAKMPASASLKEMVRLFQNNYPGFFKSFEQLNFETSDFPELNKIQADFLAKKLNITPDLNNGKELLAAPVVNKTINLELLRDEIERLESEHFKTNDTIQSLKKIHEIVSKTEAKLVVHQLLDNTTIKPDSYHAFEFSVNPLQETKLARVEIQHNRKTEDSKPRSSFSVNIEVDLSQTGEVKARLFSDENAKQIFLNFANNDFKKLAVENQEELQTQLREIPFISQLFFGSINKPAELDQNSDNQNNNTLSGTHKFDSLA